DEGAAGQRQRPHRAGRADQDFRIAARRVLPGAAGDGLAAGHRVRGPAAGDRTGHRRAGQLLGAATHQTDRRASRAGRDPRPDHALLPDRELPAGDDRHRARHAGRLRHQPDADGQVRAGPASTVLPADWRGRAVAAGAGVGARPGTPRGVGAAGDRHSQRLSVADAGGGRWRANRAPVPARAAPDRQSLGYALARPYTAMPTVLVIDDNPSVGTALELLFSLHEIDVLHADSPDAGLELLRRGGIDLVIQDMNFHADTTSGDEGVALFGRIRAEHPDMPVILLTAWTRLESAVDLVKAGAADYIGKPWDDLKLLASVNNLLELAETRRELTARSAGERGRREGLARQHDLRGLVYDDVASETVLALALQVARSELPVLVTGPNGAGKEKYAEIIHYNSAVKSGPFVAVNCGALPSELIEAELFGAEPGAYTGAGNKARTGKFEAADGGTLFLDEIGTLPPAGQVKLLR